MECIEWAGGHWNTGYPYRMRHIDEPPGPRMIAVHREVWAQANGPIPPGGVIMHTCDNPGCINVEHLRLGTPKLNSVDMSSKGRNSNQRKAQCPNGHPYDQAGVRKTGPRAGMKWRACGTCTNQRRRERYQRAR